MIAQLTRSERQAALVLLLATTICGLAMAIAGSKDPLGTHGWIALLCGIAGVFAVINAYYEPEPDASRLMLYYDDPTKVAIVLAMVWAVLGMFVGDVVAWQLVFPDMTFDAGWSRVSAVFVRCIPAASSSASAAMR